MEGFSMFDYLWLPVGIFMVCLAAIVERQLSIRARIICGFSLLLLAVPALIGFIVVSVRERFVCKQSNL